MCEHHRVGPRFIVASPINNDCSNAMMVVPGRILAYELGLTTKYTNDTK